MALAALALLIVVQAGATLLVVAGLRHRRDPAMLRHHLRAHRIVPRRWIDAVAGLLPTASIVVGVASAIAPVLTAGAARVAGAAVAVVYLIFAGYLSVLTYRDPAASCGCLGTTGERAGRSLLRAVLMLAAGAAVASPWLAPALAEIADWRLLAALTALVGAGAAVVLTAVAAPVPRRRF
ncbi:MauE/DoxX family redox-associated membrane protein [Actinoplanes sp. M2I2]|uniref:MauE/DoxX family redox-associated membrane protein n=1 Tax=Actinoplanes sp. M2I2 TaxID=1734444 RepID=UPI002020C97D|nr:MauE/DoxX family redox-associated membrane protein [Actinoplanes sp. M2I2]